MVTLDEHLMQEKYKKAELALKDKLKRNKSLRADKREIFLRSLSPNENRSFKVIANKIVLSPEYYYDFVKAHASKNKDSKEWYSFFAEIAKKSYIHKSSSSFPKDFSLITINPNLSSLYNTSLNHADIYIHARDDLYSKIDDISLSEKNALAYIDLRLYQMTPLYSSELAQIQSQDIIFIDASSALLYLEEKTLVFNEVPHYQLIRITGSILIGILRENVKKNIQFPFLDKAPKTSIPTHRKKYYGNLSISAIRLTGNNAALRYSSPLKVSLSSNRNILSMLTLSELDVLYPNIVPRHLLEVEIQRVLSAKRRPEIDDDSSESEGATFSLEELSKLDDLLKTKNPSDFRKKISSVMYELDSYLNSDLSSEHGNLIVMYVRYLLERVDGRNKIAISTFKGYLGLLKKHLFNSIEDLSRVQTHELNQILSKLKRLQYKRKSIKKVQALFGSFFTFHNQKHTLARINIASYPKSLIFESELDDIVDAVKSDAIAGKRKKGSRVKFKMLQSQALVFLAFYTGLRKNELRSRLHKDIYLYGNKLYIDVNKDGMKKLNLKMKTSNSKRRVCSIIENDQHLRIIDDFLEARMALNNKSPFLFLEVKDNYVIKSKPFPESYFDVVTNILQGFTGRYVTFHSFRHSYATYEVKKILDDTSVVDPYQLIDLSVRMGHESPETTLKVYTHRSVLNFGGVQ